MTIEANTQELRELLNMVDDLPDNPGSSEPDLVIGLNVADPKIKLYFSNAVPYTIDDVSIVSGSVSDVVAKIQQGKPVRVVLNEINFYNEYVWSECVAEASQVSVKHENYSAEYPNTDTVSLTCVFGIHHIPSILDWGNNVLTRLGIVFNATTGEPIYLKAGRLNLNDN